VRSRQRPRAVVALRTAIRLMAAMSAGRA
jgi:hypothetical protein